VKCLKCGEENHEDQKVCLHCGALTPRGGGFYYEDKKRFQLTKKHKLYGAIGLGVLLLIVILAKMLHVTPPDQVAREWFAAVSERRISAANSYTTPKLQSQLQARLMDMRAISDECYTEINEYRAACRFQPPQYDDPDNPRTARIIIALNRPDGGVRTLDLGLVKQGRAWKIDSLQF
jgi:hypothetical protein